MKRLIYLLTILFPLFASAASNDWQPVAQWPFVYQEFGNATIITSAGQTVKAKANIHVGSHYLWYESAGAKKLEAKKGTVSKVIFADGRTYYDIGSRMCYVVREDTIKGKVARVYCSEELDRKAYDELVKINRQAMQSMDVGLTGLADMYSSIADREGANNLDQEPLPMQTVFYMLYDGDTFVVNESNVLKHLAKEERPAYRKFTRSAEIIYANLSSVLNIWTAFFVNK